MLVLIWISSAMGATWTVGPSGADYTAIQDAIDGASNGDVIEVASGTYAEALNLSGLDLTITATSGSGTTVLQPPSKETAIQWTQSESGEVDGFTIEPDDARAFEIKGGNPIIKNCIINNAGAPGSTALDGGAGHIDNGTPTFETVTFNKSYGRFGGTLYAKGNASVELIDVIIDASEGSYGGALFGKSASFTGSRITITDATSENSGGAIYLEDSTLSVDDLDIQQASGTQAWGAGIYARDGSTLTLTNGSISDTFSTNYVSGYEGGAIRLEDSGTTLTADGTHFDKNKAYRGGAISLGEQTQAVLVNVIFSNHEAHVGGGAVVASANAHFICESCTVEDNTAPNGGAFYFDTNAQWSDIDSTFQRNTADDDGGAIYANDPTSLSTTGSSFLDNQATRGGAIFVDTPNAVHLTGSSFEQNKATTNGGAIYLEGTGIAHFTQGDLSRNTAEHGGAVYATGLDGIFLDWAEVRYNTATMDGGAIYLLDIQESQVQRAIFFDNGAGRNGGAWFERDGTAFSKLQTTIWQENDAVLGGAIYMDGSLGTEVINNTLVGNEATTDGDHAYLLETPIRFINNIAAHGNGTGGIYGDSSTAADGVFWYNDVWDNTIAAYTGNLTDPTGSDGNLAADPLFKAYSLDGVESNDDLHLSTGSPCIDTGWPAIKDVDGTHSDIGAFGGANPRAFDDDGDGYSDLVDCRDDDPSIYPGAPETPYDGIDQDCDGQDWTDVDGDGYDWDGVGGTDCDDNDPTVHPDALEIWYDGVDQNCDEQSDYDKDQDGFDSKLHGGDDCNDDVDSIYPGAEEVVNDGVDQDCDGTDAIDADGDGHASEATGGDDCDDERSEAYPGAEELLNGLDDDCDGYPETADRDEDGLPDYVEWAWGTDPLNPDSDGDSLKDGEEGDPDDDPWDSDSDGRINPLDDDDDGDGIPTAEEAQLADPDMDADGVPAWLDKDTDGDGRLDADEGTGDIDLDGAPDYADYDGDYTGGCVGGKSMLLLALLPLLYRRPRMLAATIAFTIAGVAITSPASAGGPDAHNLEWLNIAGPETGTFRVVHPTTLDRGVAVAGSLESAYHPLMEDKPNGPSVVVQQMSTVSLAVAISPIENLQWDLLMPIHIDVQGIQGRRAGLGDGRISTKYALLVPKDQGFGLSVQGFVWLPTGKVLLHHGAGATAGGALISMGQQIGPLRWSVNLGARIGQLAEARNIQNSHGPLAGVALNLDLPQSHSLFLEVLSQGSSGWDQWPLEVGLGMNFNTPKNTWSALTMHMAPTRAAGVPFWRIAITAGWSKTKPKEITPPPVVTAPPPPPPAPAPPTPAAPAEMSDDRIVIHQQIRFEEGSATLIDADNQPVLFAVLGILAEHPEIEHLLIVGHTNHHGAPDVNQRLSEARAKSVADWLEKNGVAKERLLHKGYGSSQPKVDPALPEAETVNRRVEFKVLRE